MLKNEEYQIEITGLTAEGNGVGRVDSMAVFVPASAVGDVLEVKILKVLKNYAFGKIQRILTHSDDRQSPDCSCFYQCGGCAFRHLTYEAELRAKERRVRDALERIGGIQPCPLRPIIGAARPQRYRNKAQIPFGVKEQGKWIMGFFAPHSHRVVPFESCPLQPERFDQVMALVQQWGERYQISVYNEEKQQGLLRHLYLREASATGELMVCLVANGESIPKAEELIELLKNQISGFQSLILNVNREKTNVILGRRCKTLWGKDTIEDRLCGLRFAISPLSFYQVNRDQAEGLYRIARKYASAGKNDLVLDLYCGAGTIGMTLAADARQVIGVEIVPEAIEDAKKNAALNRITNIRFLCADAAQAAVTLQQQGERPNVVLVDPPRKGCGSELLKTIAEMAPDRIVYVSCDPATLARDLKQLCQFGYRVEEMTPVDMFPRTAHIETCVLLSHKNS